jgi:hypothetical protein
MLHFSMAFCYVTFCCVPILLADILMHAILLTVIQLISILLSSFLARGILPNGILLSGILLSGILFCGILLCGILLSGILLRGILFCGILCILQKVIAPQFPWGPWILLKPEAGNPFWKGRASTINLLALTSSDRLSLIPNKNIFLFYKANYLNKEFNRT